jgi:hypothetical protein
MKEAELKLASLHIPYEAELKMASFLLYEAEFQLASFHTKKNIFDYIQFGLKNSRSRKNKNKVS